jgi:hypothetical protein
MTRRVLIAAAVVGTLALLTLALLITATYAIRSLE